MCFQGDEAEPYLEMQGTVLSVPGSAASTILLIGCSMTPPTRLTQHISLGDGHADRYAGFISPRPAAGSPASGPFACGHDGLRFRRGLAGRSKQQRGHAAVPAVPAIHASDAADESPWCT